MHLRPFLIAFFAAALVANTFSQTQIAFRAPDNDPVTRLLAKPVDNDPSPADRPRIVPDRASGVKAVVAVNVPSIERIAFELVNKKRAELDLPPLTWNESLSAIARGHSQDMAENRYFSHRSGDGKMVSDRADRAKVGRWRSIGENIAFNRGYDDPVLKAVELWMGSPSHRQNMFDSNWRESAIGIAIAADGSYYFTQVFLKK